MNVVRILFLLLLLTAPELTNATTHTALTVELAWLRTNMARLDVVVVDSRESHEYAAGHITGAVSIPVAETFSSGARSDLLASISEIKELLRTAGVRNDDHIVLYDNGSFADAARVFWVFEVYGHEHISILNNGFEAWVKRGAPISTRSDTRQRSDYLPSVNPRRLATKLATRFAMQNDRIVLIDARTEAEYNGQESIASRHGHIPSARNVPASDLIMGTEPQFRPIDELADLFGDIPKDKQVITYCNKGKHAAMAYFTLRSLGYDVSAYDGSWYEWGNDLNLPIAGER
ncbi:MAG: sulfurtransferase [Gammaproteobacteria bacterium]|nr:sulfurtransferase [Gammaproteobacteria bacterium]